MNLLNKAIRISLLLIYVIFSGLLIAHGWKTDRFVMLLLFLPPVLIMIGEKMKKDFPDSIGAFIIPIIAIAPLFLIYRMDRIENIQLLFYVVISAIIWNYSLRFSFLFTLGSFVMYEIVDTWKYGNLGIGKVPYDFISDGIIYAFIFSAIFMTKNYLFQSYRYQELVKELSEKNAEIEKMAITNERCRLAGEIHDTIGHTLTIVLMEMEAVKRLIDGEPDKAKGKIEQIREQIKKGLEDIRKAVRALKGEEYALPLDVIIPKMLSDIRKNTSVLIDESILVQTPLVPVQKRIICQLILEGITNGIRHGNASRFDLKVYEDNENIAVDLADNGTGTEKVCPGFGLTQMENRVKSIGGEIEFISKRQSGFIIKMSIPIGEQQEMG